MYARNQCSTPRKRRAGSNLADMGRFAARDLSPHEEGGGQLRSRESFLGGEATVNACGVAVAMLSGDSWAPHSSIGCRVNVGTDPGRLSDRASSPGEGKVRRRPRTWEGTEAP